jgi:hypothetical protein
VGAASCGEVPPRCYRRSRQAGVVPAARRPHARERRGDRLATRGIYRSGRGHGAAVKNAVTRIGELVYNGCLLIEAQVCWAGPLHRPEKPFALFTCLFNSTFSVNERCFSLERIRNLASKKLALRNQDRLGIRPSVSFDT